jgi:hypothetical protein
MRFGLMLFIMAAAGGAYAQGIQPGYICNRAAVPDPQCPVEHAGAGLGNRVEIMSPVTAPPWVRDECKPRVTGMVAVRPAFSDHSGTWVDTRVLAGCVPRSADPEALQRDRASAARGAADASDPMRLATAGGGDFRQVAIADAYASQLAGQIRAGGHACGSVLGFFKSTYLPNARVVCSDAATTVLYLLSLDARGVTVLSRLQ